jgi:hypothetical protein
MPSPIFPRQLAGTGALPRLSINALTARLSEDSFSIWNIIIAPAAKSKTNVAMKNILKKLSSIVPSPPNVGYYGKIPQKGPLQLLLWAKLGFVCRIGEKTGNTADHGIHSAVRTACPGSDRYFHWFFLVSRQPIGGKYYCARV